MADNIAVTPGTGAIVGADDVGGGVLIQRVKATWGPDGTANDVDVASGKPMPVQLRSPTGVALTVTAASTPPQATDPALVVAISPNSVNANGQATMANSASVVIASDQSAVPVRQALTAAANGLTSSRVNATASTNATNLKGSAGNIGCIDVFNNAAYSVFLKFYNKATTPIVGTDTPIWTIPIEAGGGFSREFLRGKSFAIGIGYAITKFQADSDTTVVVAGDLTGSIDWI